MIIPLQPSGAPSLRGKSFKATLRAARKQERKLRARIERAVERSKFGEARYHQGRYLRSWSAKFLQVARANRRVAEKARVPLSELPRLARHLDPSSGTLEGAVVHAMPKSSGDFRPVHSYGLEGRALQKHVTNAIRPFASIDIRQHSTGNGGRERAVERIIEAVETGHKWFMRLDIQDYYPNIDMRRLIDILVAPSAVIENTLGTPRLINVGYVPRHVNKDRLVLASRRGLSQGASSSPIIADVIVALILRDVPSDAVVVNIADDFGIMARTKRELMTLKQALISAAARCPYGHFQLIQKSTARRVSDGFSFLGYHIRYRRGVLGCAPTKENVAKFMLKAASIVAMINRHPVNGTRRLQRLVGSWRNAFRQWDAGEDCLAPRLWIAAWANHLPPGSRKAVREALRWHDGRFQPTTKWAVLDVPPSCFLTDPRFAGSTYIA